MMKYIRSAIPLMVSIFLAACSAQSAAPAQNLPAAATPAVGTNEEDGPRAVVETFGKRLQLVSLLAPSAAQDIERQYAEFVSPALLEKWQNDVPHAPGRMVSSPWPDRIEITSLAGQGPDRYAIDGYIVEITSTEIDTDKAANRVPVHLVVERNREQWLITEYTQGP